MNRNDKAYQYIKQETSNLFPRCKIVVFGSRARDDYDDKSDYDFLIVTKDQIDTAHKMQYKAQIRKALAKYKIASDILIESARDYKSKSELKGHIIRSVRNEGIVL